MLFEVILDEVQFEYIANLIQKDIETNNELKEIKEGILEDLRYYYRHRKVEN